MKSNFRMPAAIAAAALALCLVASACGGSSSNYSADTTYNGNKSSFSPSSSAAYGSATMEYDKSYAAEDSGLSANIAGSSNDTSIQSSERKTIKHADMQLETKEFDQTISEFKALVESSGGYIESESQNGASMSYNGDYYERYASINARIPADKLDEVMSAVNGMCNITSQSSSMEDITDTYYDSEAHLSALKLQEERLLDILSKADKLEDVITLEQALSDVRYEIESLTASLRRMDSQVAYSYLNVGISEVVEYQDIKIQPASFGEKLAEAGRNSMSKLTETLQGMLLFIVENGPVIIVWVIVIAAVVLIVRRIVKSVRRRHPRAPRADKYKAAGGYVGQPQPSEPRQTADAPVDAPADAAVDAPADASADAPEDKTGSPAEDAKGGYRPE